MSKSLKNKFKHRTWCKAHYERNKKSYIDKSIERHKILQLELNAIKEGTPCKDCNVYYPACVMDFDHVKGEKKFNIAHGYFRYSREAVEKEIKKCELVCANCHRIRTQGRIPR